jgi:hypothetical protein
MKTGFVDMTDISFVSFFSWQWGFRNFCSCIRMFYTILLPDDQLFLNLDVMGKLS